MLDKLTSADFAPHLSTTFSVSLGPWGQPYDPAAHGELYMLNLVEVTDLGDAAAANSARRRPFSLIFRGPHGPYLPQRTYAVNHSALGWLDLFLVPIGPDQDGMRYQAIFS